MNDEAVRALNGAGIRRFRSYLQALRNGGVSEPPYEILTDSDMTGAVDGVGIAEPREWKNRYEAATHVAELLADAPSVDGNIGLWSWLSLYYFDQVCPQALDGTRKPGRDYRHILEPEYRYAHRHLLAGPFWVYRLHGERAMLLLSSRVRTENAFHHELGSRQNLITNEAILEAANLLYLDKRKRVPKKGAQHGRDVPGSLRRFVDLMQQLDVNYDLHSMSPEGLLDLLPNEFRRWKPLRRRFRRRPEV